MTPNFERATRQTPTKPPTRRELLSHPAVRQYTLLGLAALFVIVVCLTERGLGWWALLPAFVGGATLMAQGASGPPLVMLVLAGLILASMRHPWSYGYGYWTREGTPTMTDLILCVGVTAYLVTAYRLLALTRHVFPPDPRRFPGSGFADPSRRRSADLVSVREIIQLLLSLPLWACLALVVWSWIIEARGPLDMSNEMWRMLRLIWAALTLAIGASLASAYVRRRRATPAESYLYLQDQFWRHTRSEQGRLQRRLARTRLRQQRRREAS